MPCHFQPLSPPSGLATRQRPPHDATKQSPNRQNFPLDPLVLLRQRPAAMSETENQFSLTRVASNRRRGKKPNSYPLLLVR